MKEKIIIAAIITLCIGGIINLLIVTNQFKEIKKELREINGKDGIGNILDLMQIEKNEIGSTYIELPLKFQNVTTKFRMVCSFENRRHEISRKDLENAFGRILKIAKNRDCPFAADKQMEILKEFEQIAKEELHASFVMAVFFF